MDYEPITSKTTDHLHQGNFTVSQLHAYAHEMIKQVKVELDAFKDSFAIEMTVSPDGKAVEILSPFGLARGRFSIHLRESGFYGRYSFERQIEDLLGRNVWEKVLFIDIDPESRIDCDFQFDQPFYLKRVYRNQFFELATLIAAAIGRNPSEK